MFIRKAIAGLSALGLIAWAAPAEAQVNESMMRCRQENHMYVANDNNSIICAHLATEVGDTSHVYMVLYENGPNNPHTADIGYMMPFGGTISKVFAASASNPYFPGGSFAIVNNNYPNSFLPPVMGDSRLPYVYAAELNTTANVASHWLAN